MIGTNSASTQRRNSEVLSSKRIEKVSLPSLFIEWSAVDAESESSIIDLGMLGENFNQTPIQPLKQSFV
jgi:hypothetical protein